MTNKVNNVSICEEIQFKLIYPKDFYISETTVININRFYRYTHLDKTKFSYKSCIEHLNHFCNLLTLFMGTPLYFTYIDLNLLPKRILDRRKSIESEQKCRVFFNQVGDILKKYNISKGNNMVIYRRDIVNCSDIVFDQWFDNIDKLSEVVNPYVSKLHLPLYLETKFLNVIRGLETFHRFFIQFEKVSEDYSDVSKELIKEKNLLLRYVKENISETNRDYFIQRINYEEDKNFRKRLKDTINSLPNKLSEQLFGSLNSKDKNSIISSLIDTRNYYTHRDSKKKYLKLITNKYELDKMVKKLEVILQYHIFNFIGVNSDIVVKRFNEYRSNHLSLK